MKKLFLLTTLLWAGSVSAELDPFSVFTAQTPEGCIDISITAEEMGLPELIQVGICNNPSLNRNYMSVKTAEATYGESKSSYLPSVSVSGSVSVDNDKTEGVATVDSHPYSGNLALSWLLYDFGGRSAKTDQMKAYLEKSQFTYNAVLQDTILAINQAYFDLLSAQEVLKSSETSEASFKKSYEESKRRYELGLVSASDKLLAQTSYEQSRLAVVQARNALKKAQGALAVLLNLSPDTALSVTTPKKDKDITALETDDSVQDLMATALRNRAEVKGAYSGMTAAAHNIDIARSASLPSVSAAASMGYNDNWKESNPYHLGTSAGLKLSVPLFTGFSNSYNIAKARYQYRESSLSYIETQDIVRQDVWNSYQDYMTAVDAYDISQKTLDSALENERVAFASYQVGRGSILELLTAGSQLATARQQVIVAFYSVLTSKAALYRSVGGF